MPAVDAATGKILLNERWQLALNPDGHGGMLRALAVSGCLDDARQRGIQRLFYGQVDNPLLQICDPLLIGYHVLANSEMTTQVVAKRDPLDRVGNLAIIDGRTQIIEYSDLPETAARRRNPDGTLYFWAGSIAVHVFDGQFLERMAGQTDQLPFHRADKKSAYIDAKGDRIQPHSPNSIKFERFIFDLLPFASNPIAVEGAVEEVFAPVKNAAGASTETIETARAAMVARDTACSSCRRPRGSARSRRNQSAVGTRRARDRRQAAPRDTGHPADLLSLRIGTETSAVFRGAKGDNATAIHSSVLTPRRGNNNIAQGRADAAVTPASAPPWVREQTKGQALKGRNRRTRTDAFGAKTEDGQRRTRTRSLSRPFRAFY